MRLLYSIFFYVLLNTKQFLTHGYISCSYNNTVKTNDCILKQDVMMFKASNSPSSEETQHYLLLKDLRKQGYTCPDGITYPPNPNPFVFECRIWRAAHSYAQYMGINNHFDHYDKNGKDPCDRTQATGLMACAENIAAGQKSAQSALDVFKASIHHCPNMMNPKLNRIGVGYYYAPSSTYKYYWVQNMGTDLGTVDISCNTPNNISSTPNNCVDNDPINCKAYNGYAGTQYCGRAYGNGWAFNNCKKTCRLC